MKGRQSAAPALLLLLLGFTLWGCDERTQKGYVRRFEALPGLFDPFPQFILHHCGTSYH